METVIPLIAIGGLYIISNQNKKQTQNHEESFINKHNILPNTDIPDVNYPSEYPPFTDENSKTTKLSTVNKYDTQHVYTDKYFNAEKNIEKTNSYSPLNEGNIYDNDKKYYSLNGEKVSQDYFRHNNMVPYFGGHIRSRNVDAKANEQILDSYSGSGSQSFAKREQAPLFSPGENYHWGTGMPNFNDFYKSRVNPSSRMANVKPFEEELVGPGLGLGYTTNGSDGFNSGMMNREAWMEKTVDDLRVSTNPKSSGLIALGHEGPAMHYVTNRGFLGNMEKNRPDTTFELGQDRLMTTVGLEKGPTSRSIQVDRFVSRPETTTEYAGVASNTNASFYIDGEYKESIKNQYGDVPLKPAFAGGKGHITESDYGIKTKNAYPNNRTANYQDKYFGPMGGVIGAVVAPLLDALRPSRKENTIGTLRPYQNAKACVNSSYMFNPNDKPLPTIREMTENSKFHLNTNLQNRGAYAVADVQPSYTNRKDTDDFYYVGNSSAREGLRDMKNYQAEYNQRNNDIKSSTINGRLVQGNMNLYNGNINMISKPKDNLLVNNRPLAPEGAKKSPSLYNTGKLSGSQELYQNIQLDRTQPELLNALKSNPYAIPYRGK